MNLIALLLAVAALTLFALAYRGHRYGSLGLGLALFILAWIIQNIWDWERVTL